MTATQLRRGALFCNSLFVLLLGGVHLLDREPDPLVVSVSYYALTSHGWLATCGFLALAGGAAFVALLARQSGDRSRMYALLSSSLAIALVAIFPSDPWYPWEKTPTTVGAVHAVAACVPIVLLPLFALRDLVAHIRRTAQPAGVVFASLYVLASAAVGAYVGSTLLVGAIPTLAGLAERAVVLTGVLWLSAMAVDASRSYAR